MILNSHMTRKAALLVSIMLIGMANSAYITKISKFDTKPVPHNQSISATKLPPFIPMRTKSYKGYKRCSDDTNNIETKGNYKIAGLELSAPSNGFSKGSSLIKVTPSSIDVWRDLAGITSTSFCPGVYSAGAWSCVNCKKYLPDAKVIVTFATPIYDISSFLLRSESKKTIYLVFRGSMSTGNYLVDVALNRFDYTPVSNAKIHAGFYTAYGDVSLYFYSQLQAQHAAYPDYSVTVIGHSLGVGQALIAGMDLYQRVGTLNPDNLKIYIFGCPRVGDENFANYVQSTGINIVRSVHKRDFVPQVPSESFGYLHTGVEVWEKENSNGVIICTRGLEDPSCSKSIFPFTMYSDHFEYFGVREGFCTM